MRRLARGDHRDVLEPVAAEPYLGVALDYPVQLLEKDKRIAFRRGLYPFLAVGILLHGFVWLGVIGVITFVTFFAYAMLEAEGVDVTERRKRAVVAWEWVSYGLTILAVLSMLIPQLRSAIDARMDLVKNWIVGLPKGTSSLKFILTAT